MWLTNSCNWQYYNSNDILINLPAIFLHQIVKSYICKHKWLLILSIGVLAPTFRWMNKRHKQFKFNNFITSLSLIFRLRDRHATNNTAVRLHYDDNHNGLLVSLICLPSTAKLLPHKMGLPKLRVSYIAGKP